MKPARNIPVVPAAAAAEAGNRVVLVKLHIAVHRRREVGTGAVMADIDGPLEGLCTVDCGSSCRPWCYERLCVVDDAMSKTRQSLRIMFERIRVRRACNRQASAETSRVILVVLTRVWLLGGIETVSALVSDLFAAAICQGCLHGGYALKAE